jgi:glutathione S-transferase
LVHRSHDGFVDRSCTLAVDVQMLAVWTQAKKGKTERAEGMKQTLATVETLEGALRDCGKGKPFFGVDSVGYVDIVLGGVLGWVRANEERHGAKPFDPGRTPSLEAVEPVMHNVSKLVESGKMLQARQAPAAAAGAGNISESGHKQLTIYGSA